MSRHHGAADGRSFGARLRRLARRAAARRGPRRARLGLDRCCPAAHLRAFVATAGAGERQAVTNNVYSADVAALGGAAILASVPDLPSDNAPAALARREAAVAVDVRPSMTPRLDLDSPLDLELSGAPTPGALAGLGIDGAPPCRAAEAFDELTASRQSQRGAARRRAAVRSTLRARGTDRVANASARRGTGAADGRPRIRRGRRVDARHDPRRAGRSVRLAPRGAGGRRRDRHPRPPRPSARCGGIELAEAEDRYASDLLLPDRIEDPWLRAHAARRGRDEVPIALGGHTLVGPGLRLALGLGVTARQRATAPAASRSGSGAFRSSSPSPVAGKPSGARRADRHRDPPMAP